MNSIYYFKNMKLRGEFTPTNLVTTLKQNKKYINLWFLYYECHFNHLFAKLNKKLGSNYIKFTESHCCIYTPKIFFGKSITLLPQVFTLLKHFIFCFLKDIFKNEKKFL